MKSKPLISLQCIVNMHNVFTSVHVRHSQKRSLLKRPLAITFNTKLITLLLYIIATPLSWGQTVPFITKWEVSSTDLDITIPTIGTGYNYTVDWGDNSTPTTHTGNATHTYTQDGTYEVSISGNFPRIYFRTSGDRLKITEIVQWGDIAWSSMEDAFYRCQNLTMPDPNIDAPDLSNVTNLDSMFYFCWSFNGKVSHWDVSNVEIFAETFSECRIFNQPIGSWNMSNATSLYYMFYYAYDFNQPLNDWDVSNVVNMEGVFSETLAFNQDLNNWNVGNVTTMYEMFDYAEVFNGNISSWNVSNVTDMEEMFYSAESFNGDVSSWDIGNVENMEGIFNDVSLSRTNYDALLTGWSTDSSGVDGDGVDDVPQNIDFNGGDSYYCNAEAARANLINTHGWSISDQGHNCVFTMIWEIPYTTTDLDLDLTIPTYPGASYNYTVNWGDGTITSGHTGDATHTFSQIGPHEIRITGTFPRIYFNDEAEDKLKIKTISSWGEDLVWSSMESAFEGCTNLDVTASDVPNLSLVTDMSYMFSGCENLVGTSALRSWDVSNVTDMSHMFDGAIVFNQNLDSWDISSLTDAVDMFNGSGLSTVNYDRLLRGWSTLDTGESINNNVTLGASGIYYCTSDEERDLLDATYGWDISDTGSDPACLSYTYNDAWSPSDPNGRYCYDIVIETGDVTISSDTSCKHIDVAAGAGLIIDAGATITAVSGMTLESSATSYSSLILIGSMNGDVAYHRHVNEANTSSGSNSNNDLISPPLSGQTFGDFRATNLNIPAGTISGTTSYLFGPFDNSSDAFELYDAADDSALLAAGKGYRTGSTDNGNFRFTGTVQTGMVTTPVDGMAFSLWHLIGNPYPSYMKVYDFINTNSGLLDTDAIAIYGYDGTASDGWTIYNLATDVNTVIAPGQGFFVKANTSADGDIIFTPEMRSTGTEDDFIVGRSSPLQYLKLGISTTANAYMTEFYFNENASTGLDPGYDASLWGALTPDFVLYSHLVENNTGVPLALQTLHTDDMSNVSIPLGVNAYANVPLTFTIEDATIPDTINIYLDDLQTNTATLLNGSDYQIVPSEDLSGTGRFYLRFQDTSLSISSPEWDGLRLYTDQLGERIVVQGQHTEATNFSLYDLKGRLVLETALAKHINTQYVDASKLNTGVYIVRLDNGYQQRTQKVIWH